MAVDLPLPVKIIAHPHWTVNHHKMSKSLGNVIDPKQLMGTYGTDCVRYYILSMGGVVDDGGNSKVCLQHPSRFLFPFVLLCKKKFN